MSTRLQARFIFGTGLALSLGGCGYLLIRDQQKKDSLRRKQVEGIGYSYYGLNWGLATDELIASNLRTGDILLFNRAWYQLNPLDAVTCLLSKYRSQTLWDHIGIILEKHGIPYVCESTRSGVQCQPYNDRLANAKGHDVAVRSLNVRHDDELSSQLESFIQALRSRGDRPAVLASLELFPDHHMEMARRVYFDLHQLRNEADDLQTRIVKNQGNTSGSSKDSSSYVKGLVDRRSRTLQRIGELEQILQHAPAPPTSSPVASAAAFVAAAYQAMGLLPTDIPPGAFSTEQFDSSSSLRLLKGATLKSEIMIRSN
eukprot:GILK01011384.1.p1 GENE.GILK01011384.1~~GILK01011384.1.p1  ORF type:complete len:344 (-),score=23.12 GILK01011384.1:148-1089(-)